MDATHRRPTSIYLFTVALGSARRGSSFNLCACPPPSNSTTWCSSAYSPPLPRTGTSPSRRAPDVPLVHRPSLVGHPLRSAGSCDGRVCRHPRHGRPDSPDRSPVHRFNLAQMAIAAMVAAWLHRSGRFGDRGSDARRPAARRGQPRLPRRQQHAGQRGARDDGPVVQVRSGSSPAATSCCPTSPWGRWAPSWRYTYWPRPGRSLLHPAGVRHLQRLPAVRVAAA